MQEPVKRVAVPESVENLLIFVLYLASFGLILFNDGVFWDSWVFYNQEPAALKTLFSELGFFLKWPAYLHNALLPASYGVTVERGIIFAAYLGAAYFLKGVLRQVKEMDASARLFVTLSFALFPVNFARIALCNIHYAICYFLFFFAFYLFSLFLRSGKTTLRILALLVFFFSFSTNALLSFYAVVLAYAAYQSREGDGAVAAVKRAAFRYADFIAVPLVYYAAKTIFFKPYGLYAAVYPISLKAIVLSPLSSLAVLKTSFVTPLDLAFKQVGAAPFLTLSAGLALFFFFDRYRGQEEKRGRDAAFFFAGVAVFYLAAFCYLAVGYMPALEDWESRHQLLLPLGSALMLCYGVRLAFAALGWGRRTESFALAVLLGLFTQLNHAAYLDYLRDWYKQYSAMENIREIPAVRSNAAFLVEDRARGMDARGRTYRFYEYTGWLKLVFGDETRLAADSANHGTPGDYSGMASYPQYNMRGYKFQPFTHLLVIEPGNYDISGNGALRLLYTRCNTPKRFKAKLKRAIKVTCSGLPPSAR